MHPRKEWVRITRSPNGTAAVTVTVTVTVQQDEAVVRWTEKAYSSQIEKSTTLAREKAHRALSAALGVIRDEAVPA